MTSGTAISVAMDAISVTMAPVVRADSSEVFSGLGLNHGLSAVSK